MKNKGLIFILILAIGFLFLFQSVYGQTQTGCKADSLKKACKTECKADSLKKSCGMKDTKADSCCKMKDASGKCSCQKAGKTCDGKCKKEIKATGVRKETGGKDESAILQKTSPVI